MDKYAPTPDVPALIRGLLLLLMPLMLLSFWLDGQNYDPGTVQLNPASGTDKAAINIPDKLLQLNQFSQIQHFSADNLYEYINGHAEFFLSAGFRKLYVAEYGDDGRGGPVVVVNLYDMGKALHAFGVLMEEAPAGTALTDIKTVIDNQPKQTIGFNNQRSVQFISGPLYIQITVFNERIQALDLAVSLFQQLHQNNQFNERLQFDFPEFGQALETRFIKEDYRGLDFLDNILERRFQYHEQTFDVFVMNIDEQQAEQQKADILKQFSTFYDSEKIAFKHQLLDNLNYYLIEDPYEGAWFIVLLEQQILGVFNPLNEQLQQIIRLYHQSKR